MRRFAFPIAFLVFAITAAAVAQTPDYEIKLVRPPKVGQKYTLTVDGAMTRTATIAVGERKVVNEDGFGVHLEATVEVLEVNKDGEEAKVACRIAKFTRLTRDGEAELLAAPRVVTATGGKTETEFAVDEGQLSDEAKEALDLVLMMGEDDGYNDDIIYGTKKRQPVGGSWDVDQKAAADEAKADEVVFDPNDIVGSLKLEKVEKVDGVECLHIAGTTEIRQFTAKPPENMTMEKGSLKAKYSGAYPVDGLTGTLAETMSVTHNARFKGKAAEGQESTVDSKVQRATEMKRTWLKE
jgi:hypothetical protein